MAGAPTPPPPGAETPISGSAGDEEPQHHFGATSGIRIAKLKGKGSEVGIGGGGWGGGVGGGSPVTWKKCCR